MLFFGKKKLIEEQSRTIEELNEKLSAQQQELDSLKEELASYKEKEHAISRAITDAAETASRIISDAQKESDEIYDSAQQEYFAFQRKGEGMIQSAYENARDIIKDAEKTSEKKIKETDAAVNAYVQLLTQFNESMKEQARQAEENVKKVSEFYVRLSSALPDLFAEVPKLDETLISQEEEPLPDPEGDPAQLMHNIYTIQKRYLPHEDMPDRTSFPEQAPEGEETAKQEQEQYPESDGKPIPNFSPEEGDVVRVSDLVEGEEETIDTDELIDKITAMDGHPLDDRE